MIGLGIAHGRARRGTPARDEESGADDKDDKHAADVYSSLAVCLSKQRQRRRMTLAVLASISVLGVGLLSTTPSSAVVEQRQDGKAEVPSIGNALSGSGSHQHF